eukprot:TRINITY_DN2931_c0_g1_i2.p1 TRINITY_DN2931_c0_g1~~TRINITY_DN2931_c0_g1_i2.p1  ORF type:complete len:225 (-),score=54.04 TRINITY_DN2931_c0_g1_i2:51-725(-)
MHTMVAAAYGVPVTQQTSAEELLSAVPIEVVHMSRLLVACVRHCCVGNLAGAETVSDIYATLCAQVSQFVVLCSGLTLSVLSLLATRTALDAQLDHIHDIALAQGLLARRLALTEQLTQWRDRITQEMPQLQQLYGRCVEFVSAALDNAARSVDALIRDQLESFVKEPAVPTTKTNVTESEDVVCAALNVAAKLQVVMVQQGRDILSKREAVPGQAVTSNSKLF